MKVGIVVLGSETEKLSVIGMVEGTVHVPNLYVWVGLVDGDEGGDRSMLVGSPGSRGRRSEIPTSTWTAFATLIFKSPAIKNIF